MRSSSIPIVMLALVLAWCALKHDSPTATSTATLPTPPPATPSPAVLTPPCETVAALPSPPICPPAPEPALRLVEIRSGETGEQACRRHGGRACEAVKDAVGKGGVTIPVTCSTELRHVRHDEFEIGKKRGQLPTPVIIWDELDDSSALAALCGQAPTVVEF